MGLRDTWESVKELKKAGKNIADRVEHMGRSDQSYGSAQTEVKTVIADLERQRLKTEVRHFLSMS
jgi:hypothetical protein